MKVSACAPTATWVAGVFNIIPALAFLGILGVYSLYPLYTGIAALMKPAGGQGSELHDRRHRLCDHRLDRHFRHHGDAVRRDVVAD